MSFLWSTLACLCHGSWSCIKGLGLVTKASVIFKTFQCSQSTVFAATSFIGLCHLHPQINLPHLIVEVEFYSSAFQMSMFSVNYVNEANDGHFRHSELIHSHFNGRISYFRAVHREFVTSTRYLKPDDNFKSIIKLLLRK